MFLNLEIKMQERVPAFEKRASFALIKVRRYKKRQVSDLFTVENLQDDCLGLIIAKVTSPVVSLGRQQWTLLP